MDKSVFEERLRREMDACCLGLASDEVLSDFHLVRLCRSMQAQRVISAFHSVDSDKRMAMALAMATHPSARSESQQILVKEFRLACDRVCYSPDILAAMREELSWVGVMANPRRGGLSGRALKGRVRSNFLRELRSAYNPDISSSGVNEYECSTQYKQWRIVTDFDFGGNYQFRASFRLEHPLLEKRSWRGGATLGSLLGLGELGWDSIMEPDLEKGAQAATLMCNDMCRRFQAVMRGVGDDLTE